VCGPNNDVRACAVSLIFPDGVLQWRQNRWTDSEFKLLWCHVIWSVLMKAIKR